MHCRPKKVSWAPLPSTSALRTKICNVLTHHHFVDLRQRRRQRPTFLWRWYRILNMSFSSLPFCFKNTPTLCNLLYGGRVKGSERREDTIDVNAHEPECVSWRSTNTHHATLQRKWHIYIFICRCFKFLLSNDDEFGLWMKTFTFATGTNFEESRAQALFWGDTEPLVGRVLLFAGQNRTRRCEAIGRDSFYLHVFLKLHVDRPGGQIDDRRLTKLKYFRNPNVSPTKAALLRPSGILLFNGKYGRNFAVRRLLFSFFWPVWGIPLILLPNKGVYTASANWPGRCFSSPAQQSSNNILQTFHLTLVWESKQRALCVPLQEEEFLFWEALKRCVVCRFCQAVLNTEMNGRQRRANSRDAGWQTRTLHQAKKPADRGH